MSNEPDFGDDFAESTDTPAAASHSAIVPYGRMKPDPGITEAWARERERRKRRFVSPIDAFADLQAKRKLPTLPLPPAWTDFSSRAKLYAGEVMGVSGPTGGGKTSFAIEIATAAAGQGIPVLWLPKELDPPEVNLRIVANRAKTHVMRIREDWADEDIMRTLIAVSDRWRFVDYERKIDQQIAAMEAAVLAAIAIYGRPPLLVVDYIGKFSLDRQELAETIETIRDMTVRLVCFTMLLSQTSRANNDKLTGKVELDSAADAIGVSAETGELEHAASVSVALNVFKADDAPALDAHVLVPKARGTGREGRVGFQFIKAGGQWREQSFLPSTPQEVSNEIAKQKKDKTRITPPSEPKDVRREINIAKQERADWTRRDTIMDALRASGAEGLGARELKKIPRLSNWKSTRNALDELLTTGQIEQRDNGRWRILRQTSLT